MRSPGSGAGRLLARARQKAKFQDIVPIAAFIIILAYFSIMSYDQRNGTIRLLTMLNLNGILTQVMQTVTIASGTLFVVSQGHMDMSVGVNLALSGIMGTWIATITGRPFLLIPVALLVGLAVGLFNGIIVSKFKVPSFMLTLAMLIGVRGLVNFIQVKIATHRLPKALEFLGAPYAKIPIFVAMFAIMAYIFEFTNVGRYSKAIGENEVTARYVGVPVDMMKILAFALSGLMAGAASIFNVATIGSTTQMMGVFFEMKVIMAIFLGGILVTGGSSARIYKIVLGSVSIEIIINGLAIMGRSELFISEIVQGALLLVILALSAFAGFRAKRPKQLPDEIQPAGPPAI